MTSFISDPIQVLVNIPDVWLRVAVMPVIWNCCALISQNYQSLSSQKDQKADTRPLPLRLPVCQDLYANMLGKVFSRHCMMIKKI
jgi:hypothetical protein